MLEIWLFQSLPSVMQVLIGWTAYPQVLPQLMSVQMNIPPTVRLVSAPSWIVN
jgi:hypothetical protein